MNYKKLMCNLGKLTYLFAITALLTCEKVPDHCGGKGKDAWYDPDIQFCFEKKAYPLCSGRNFNPLTEGCMMGTTVGTRCLGDIFVDLGTPCNGYILSTASAPAEGGDITITRTSPGPNFAAGELVNLVAQEKTGFVFAGWTGAHPSSNTDVTITMDANKPMVAMFRPNTRALATTAFPPNGGNINRTPSSDGIHVTVTAVPTDGYTFTKWEGASTSTEPTVTVTVDEGKTLVAMFTPIPFTLTVNANPPTSGTVFVNNTATTGATAHNMGALVRVLARAAEGYEFAGWTGTGAPAFNNAEITVTMNGNQTLTANFRRHDGPPVNPCAGLTTASPGSACCNAQPTFNGCSDVDTTETLYCEWGMLGGCWAIESPDEPSENPGLTNLQNCMMYGTLVPDCNHFPCTGLTTAEPGSACCLAFPPFEGCGEIVVEEGSFIDARNGQTYRTVKIGNLTWMAENLNFPTNESSCFNYNESNCAIYGRLYTQNAAMTACPTGWRLPSNDDWRDLVARAGPFAVAGINLKSQNGWDNNGNGIDKFRFTALPAGTILDDGNSFGIGWYSHWWTSVPEYYWGMREDYDFVYEGTLSIFRRFSVRCVQSGRSL